MLCGRGGRGLCEACLLAGGRHARRSVALLEGPGQGLLAAVTASDRVADAKVISFMARVDCGAIWVARVCNE